MATGRARPIRVVALTPAGAALAHGITRRLVGAECWLPISQAKTYPQAMHFERLTEVFQEAFEKSHNLVCIMAAGIVVRQISPYLQSKATDPAVVVVDEGGRFAVSLLSGHLGGSNTLAREIAGLIGGTAVITTATEVHGLPAFDVLAPQWGLALENLPAVRGIHMAMLAGTPIRLVDSDGWLAAALAPINPDLIVVEADLEKALCLDGPTVYVGDLERPWPGGWLRLRPQSLVAGVGCNKGASSGEILELIYQTFQQEAISLPCLKTLATIAAKKTEPGLIEAARRLGVELIWFSTAELKGINVPHPSAVVTRHVGVASVCEAAARRASQARQLLVPKQKTANVTLAVARVAWRS